MQNRTKMLIAGGAVVAAAAGVGIGFASFNATTGNQSNSVSTGTIVLSQTNPDASTCLSTTSGSTNTNATQNCSNFAAVSIAKPGDTSSALFTLKNGGSLNATVFKVFANGCTPTNATGATYNGTGDLCNQLQMTISEVDSTGKALGCVYGTANTAGTDCTFDATHTPKAFATATGSSTNGQTISNGLNAGATRYFKVNLQLPQGSDNSFQGRSASFDLNWFIAQ